MSLQSAIVSQLNLSNNSYSAGANGEALAVAMLKRAGYQADLVPRSEHAGDVRAVEREHGQIWRIEVKTARRSPAGRWQFNLNKNDEHGVTCCQQSDVLLLLAVLPSGLAVPFVIPCQDVRGLQSITLPSHPDTYSGRWAAYRQGQTINLGVTLPC